VLKRPGISARNSLFQLLRSEWVFGCSLAAGITLRLYQIRRQIPADDEWHALTAVLYSDYPSILTHFGSADRSIPLTAFYEILSHTVGLSEMEMRFLPLACGIAALLVVPLVAGFAVGRPAARITGSLLALSPLHIYFSRYARPYGITMLIAWVGLFAFYRWWVNAQDDWRWVYVACAVAGPYFHLVVAPVLLSPLVLLLFWSVASRTTHQDHFRWRQIGSLIVALAGGFCLLFLLPVLVDFGSLQGKVSRSGITWNSISGAAHLLAGSRSNAFVMVAALLCVAGAVILYRRSRRLAAFLLFVVFCQALFAVATAPEGIHVPIVLARYLLALLPILLLLAAVSVQRLDQALGKLSYYPAGSLAALLVLAQFFAGPLRSIYYFPNNWTNHAIFQYYYYRPEGQNPYEDILRPKAIPAFYSRLASLPRGSVSVVEAPWYYEWQNIHFLYYQQAHRQWMYVGFVDENVLAVRTGELPRALPGFWFRNFVHVADLAGLRYRHVNYVIFHKDIAHEIPNLAPRPAVDVSHWMDYYRREFGAPIFEDTLLAVFDVSRGLPQRHQATKDQDLGLK
jgi:hypothetical protein